MRRHDRELLVMLAREPAPGEAKTRLAPALGRAGAAALSRAFIEDLCAALSPRFPMALACTPSPEARLFRTLARRHRLALLPQGPGDLGMRMRRVAEAALARAERVVLIGSDLPTLPAAVVADGFRALRTARVVLGPSLDGGYYLLGLRGRPPAIFTRMPWGSERVLGRTLGRLRAERVRHALLRCWYDVDTPDDLALLVRHLRVLATLGESPCPRTRRLLASLTEQRVQRARRAMKRPAAIP